MTEELRRERQVLRVRWDVSQSRREAQRRQQQELWRRLEDLQRVHDRWLGRRDVPQDRREELRRQREELLWQQQELWRQREAEAATDLPVYVGQAPQAAHRSIWERPASEMPGAALLIGDVPPAYATDQARQEQARVRAAYGRPTETIRLTPAPTDYSRADASTVRKWAGPEGLLGISEQEFRRLARFAWFDPEGMVRLADELWVKPAAVVEVSESLGRVPFDVWWYAVRLGGVSRKHLFEITQESEVDFQYFLPFRDVLGLMALKEPFQLTSSGVAYVFKELAKDMGANTLERRRWLFWMISRMPLSSAEDRHRASNFWLGDHVAEVLRTVDGVHDRFAAGFRKYRFSEKGSVGLPHRPAPGPRVGDG